MSTLGLLLAVSLAAVSCVIETPVLESGESTSFDPAPTATLQIEPTAVPTPSTPQPETPQTPTPEPTLPPPTVEVAPQLTPEPTTPALLPTVTALAGFEPTIVPAGLVAIPVLSTTFRLDNPRPILQLGGHTLIYLDDQAGSEIDIFTPVAFDDGTLIGAYDEVISFLQSTSLLELEEAEPVTIAGHNTRVFEGLGIERSRAFVTDTFHLKDDDFGWVPPDQIKLWVVDHPWRPVIVTAEALTNSGQYDEALALADNILSTIDFD